jgi:hypothetical protein
LGATPQILPGQAVSADQKGNDSSLTANMPKSPSCSSFTSTRAAAASSLSALAVVVATAAAAAAPVTAIGKMTHSGQGQLFRGDKRAVARVRT